MISIADARLTK